MVALPRRSVELRIGDEELYALIARVGCGEESALADLFGTTGGLIFGLLLRILGNSAAAEEVLLEVYAQVWRQAVTFDKRRKPLLWLITIAYSRAIDQLRAVTYDQQHDGSCEITGEYTPPVEHQADVVPSGWQRLILSALDALIPDQQEMIEFAYFPALSQSEVEAHLGLPFGRVKREMRLGMMKLGDLFKSQPIQFEVKL